MHTTECHLDSRVGAACESFSRAISARRAPTHPNETTCEWRTKKPSHSVRKSPRSRKTAHRRTPPRGRFGTEVLHPDTGKNHRDHFLAPTLFSWVRPDQRRGHVENAGLWDPVESP